MVAEPAIKVATPLSVSAFAREVGVDPKMVRKAIKSGRLLHSLGRSDSGKTMIADPTLAHQEWVQNRDDGKIRDKNGHKLTGHAKLMSIADERRRLIQAQLRKIEQAIRVRAGELVPAREMEMRFTTRVITARTKLLGMLSRAKQLIPHLTVTEIAILEGLIRESLEELADAEPL